MALTYDGSRWASGVKIYVDGEDRKLEILARRPQQPGRREAGAAADRRRRRAGEPVPGPHRRGADLQPGAVGGRGRDAGRSHAGRPRSRRCPRTQRTAAQADKIRDYFLEHALPARIAEARTRLIDAQAQRDAFYQSLPTVMVMEEMPTPRETHVLIRGMYDQPGEVVTPTLPAVLASSPTAYPPNRLGLARGWSIRRIR